MRFQDKIAIVTTFAPAVFGALRQVTKSYKVPFLLAAIIQL
jgi:cyanate permease